MSLNHQQLQIEKDIPVRVVQSRVSGMRYPVLARMAVGDSFEVAGDGQDVHRIRCAASSFGKRHQVRFVTRTTELGCRVWRVK
jgi:hypothetical protein